MPQLQSKSFASPDETRTLPKSHADIVKLEISHPPAGELAQRVADLKPRGVQLIAENVETPEDFESCVALGFTGFQGYFLQHPQTFRAKRVPSSRLSTLRLVASLSNEQYSIDEVETLIGQNVSNLIYVVPMAAFILALRFLSSPRHARLGNQIGAVGMLVAVVVTLLKSDVVTGWSE